MGDNHISALGDGFSDEKFQFPGLIAAGCKSGAVIPLNP
jgi:hypothetical protein